MRQVTTQDAPLQIGPYAMQDILGEGATGIVYRVADAAGRVLALKVLRKELSLNDRERARFLEEAERLRRVRHPALVEVIDAGVLPTGQPFIAMPFLNGCSLAQRLQRGPMRFDVALHLFEQLAEALHSLHRSGLVHRDIKPENIFVVEGDQRAILLDLGIARDVNASPSTTTHAGLIRGTPAYMAPERFFGQPATPATDIYELGVVLYVTLVGALPWTRFDDPTERMRPAPPATRGVVLPPRLSSTLMRALSVTPGERPHSAEDFATAVLEALSPESARQIANQATAFVSRVPPGHGAAFAPTAYATSPPPMGATPPPPPTKKRASALMIAAMTGASLLGTGGLAVALLLKAPRATDAAPVAQATTSTGATPALVPVTPLTPAVEDPQASNFARSADSKPDPSLLASADAGARLPKAKRKAELSDEPASNEPPTTPAKRLRRAPPAPVVPATDALNNCRILELFVCDPDLRASAGALCTGVKGRISLAEHASKGSRTTIDHGCAQDLRALAAQAR